MNDQFKAIFLKEKLNFAILASILAFASIAHLYRHYQKFRL